MVVAVAVVGMVQMAVHQVVDVISVRHRLVAASGSVGVIGTMPAALVTAGAGGRVGLIDTDRVLAHVLFVRMVEVAVVQIVHMTLVNDRGVLALGAVDMLVVRVGFVSTIAHAGSSQVC